jgi:hypothetical protein
MNDMPRPVATNDASDFALPVEEVAKRYEHAGHPRTIRTLQRYCKSGHLDALKKPTLLGDMYLVTPQSVERHLAQIEEMERTTVVATGRDEPRSVATSVVHENMETDTTANATTSSVPSRPVATEAPDTSRFVSRLESENEFLRGQPCRRHPMTPARRRPAGSAHCRWCAIAAPTTRCRPPTAIARS